MEYFFQRIMYFLNFYFLFSVDNLRFYEMLIARKSLYYILIKLERDKN